MSVVEAASVVAAVAWATVIKATATRATATGLPVRVLYSFPHPLGSPGIGTTAYFQVLSLWRQAIPLTVMCSSLARPLPAGLPVVQTTAIAGRRVPARAVGVQRARAWHDAVVAGRVRRGGFDVVHTWPGAALRTLRAANAVGAAGLREVPNTHTAHAY
nr:hypothetical protein [Micromonospora sp. DSM 115978]